ncbi:MAG: ABC transporter permease [Halobacteria archaeon]
MQRVVSIAIRIFHQIQRDRRTVGLLVIAPFLLMVLFGWAFSGEIKNVKIGAVNLDSGYQELNLPDEFIQEIARCEEVKLVYIASENEAIKAVKNGVISGAIVFEENFTKQAMQREATRYTLYIDSSNTQVAQAAMKAVQDSISTVLARRTSSPLAMELNYIYGRGYEAIDFVGPAIIGLVAFFFTFLITTVSFLRERTQGTMERLLASPVRKIEIILGYLMGFSFVAIVQSFVTLSVAIFLFQVAIEGSVFLVFLIVLIMATGALGLGIFASTLAKTEFQVIQFIPTIILPQLVLSGVWWPLESIPDFIRPISYLLPLTYSNIALREVMLKGSAIAVVWREISILIIFAITMVLLSTKAFKKEID